MKIPAGQRVFTRSSISSEQLEFFIPAPISKLCLELPDEEIIVDASSNSQNGLIRPFAAIIASRGRMMLSTEVLGQTRTFIKLVDHWTNKRLSTDSICDLHAQLTGKGGVSSQFRDSIVWVDGLCPRDAKLIPGPASGVMPALQDYFDFLARRDIHDWIKLAIGYFQTLMTHPFFDGNGRLARTIALIRAQRFLGVAQAYALTAALSLHRRALRCFLDEVRRGELANYLDYWRKLIAWSADCVAHVACTRERAREKIRIEIEKLRISERVSTFLLDCPIFCSSDMVGRLSLSSKLVSLHILALERTGVIEVHHEANHSRYYRCATAIRFWQLASEATASTSARLLTTENSAGVTSPTP